MISAEFAGFDEQPELTNRVRSSFAHEQKYSDGQIFRNIRLSYLKKRYDDEKIWWARLTPTKAKDLRQLLRNQALTDAFDRLLVFQGMWEPIQLGTLHRLHGLRCAEVSDV